jgi:hypothetical protein
MTPRQNGEQEMVALVKNADDGPMITMLSGISDETELPTERKPVSNHFKRWILLALLLLAFGASMLLFDTEEEEERPVDGDVVFKDPSTESDTPFVNNSTVIDPYLEFPDQANEIYAELDAREILPPLNDDDDYSAPALLQRFVAAKEKLFEKLRGDYGDAFEPMWMREQGATAGRSFLVPTTSGNASFSIGRLERKLTMKILQVQMLMKKKRLSSLHHSKTKKKNHKLMIPFIWATGGHSASAGHGNYHNESYTAAMERAAIGVFEAAGIHFIGRNYAMGGTGSGPELALVRLRIRV